MRVLEFFISRQTENIRLFDGYFSTLIDTTKRRKVMRPKQTRWIAALLMVYLTLSGSAYADKNQQNEGRLMMGFYASSITELANRSDIEVSLNFWAKNLIAAEGPNNNLNISLSGAILFDRIEDLRAAFEQGELDMIVAPPLLIAKYFKRNDLVDGFMGVHEGKKSDQLLLIARTDKNINGVKDILGKRLVMQENDELAEMFLDTLVLKELRKSYKNIGLSVQHQAKSSRIVLDVFFDKADVAVIYSSTYNNMTELNPDIKNKIKTLNEYPVKSKNFSYFRVNYPWTHAITEASLTFDQSARGQQILEVFKTPEIDYCRVAELDSVDKFYKDYLQLKRSAKK